MVIEVPPKKRIAPQRATTGSRAFAVVLEDLHAKFDVFGEALSGVRSNVAALQADVAELKSDVAGLQELRPALAAVRDDVGVLRRDVELLKVAVLDNVREIKQLRKAR